MLLLRPLPLLVATVLLCLGVAAAVTALGGEPLTPPDTAPARPLAPPAAEPAAARAGPAADRSTVRALAVLRRWDRSRAAAYASGDVVALRRLYLPGAAAGRNDARLLRRYVERGLVVRDLELRRSSVDVMASTDRRLRVAFAERLAGATVVAAGGGERALPRDRPQRRVVMLVRAGSGWQVASVVTPRSTPQ